MGLFNRKKPTNQRDNYSLVNRAGDHARPSTKDVTHHASWSSNGVTCFVNSSGVSWTYDKKLDTIMNDDGMTDAAIAQLEEAYHLPISHPRAEENIMSLWRAVAEIANQEFPKDARAINFHWSPPLPRTN